MATSLRLNLPKYDAVRYMCGCSIEVAFQDAVSTLGLYTPMSAKGENARSASGLALYDVQSTRHVFLAVLHVIEDEPDYCCLSLNFLCEDAAVSSMAQQPRVSLPKLADGLHSLMEACSTRDRRAEASVSWKAVAPALRSFVLPDGWPGGVSLDGVRLSAPGGRAYAIVQEFQDQEGDAWATTNAFVEGGDGLSPGQVRKVLGVLSRLAAAFRDGNWAAVAKQIEDYDAS